MNMMDILVRAPQVLGELTRELVRRGDQEYRTSPQSQVSACFLLAIRSASLLNGMGRLLSPEMRDSAKIVARGFIEARDLLMTFRFDDDSIRRKIGYWFAGNADSSWKAEHTRCEQYIERLGLGNPEFSTKWSQTTTLVHPTRYAVQNSIACTTLWAATPPRMEDFAKSMEAEIADYLTCLATLIVVGTYDLPGLVPLHCDPDRMPNTEEFRESVNTVVIPILNKTEAGDLPANRIAHANHESRVPPDAVRVCHLH